MYLSNKFVSVHIYLIWLLGCHIGVHAGLIDLPVRIDSVYMGYNYWNWCYVWTIEALTPLWSWCGVTVVTTNRSKQLLWLCSAPRPSNAQTVALHALLLCAITSIHHNYYNLGSGIIPSEGCGSLSRRVFHSTASKLGTNTFLKCFWDVIMLLWKLLWKMDVYTFCRCTWSEQC